MKIIRYEWENSFLMHSLSRSLFSYDNYTDQFSCNFAIKTNISTNKNIDFAKLLSFNYIFFDKKSFFSLSQNVDKNPLKLKQDNKKSINSSFLIKNNQTMFYVYFLYLLNLFFSKNIKVSTSVGDVYNSHLNELNSILKIGYAYNVLDVDPSVDLRLSKLNISFIKNLLK